MRGTLQEGKITLLVNSFEEIGEVVGLQLGVAFCEIPQFLCRLETAKVYVRTKLYLPLQ